MIVPMFSHIYGKDSIRDGRHHDIRVARSDKKLQFALLSDSISQLRNRSITRDDVVRLTGYYTKQKNADEFKDC